MLVVKDMEKKKVKEFIIELEDEIHEILGMVSRSNHDW